jgi:exopolyphosphatase / guanosine-5'-triphosphate,3'-diphosphate pyrophosphatase
VLSFELFPIYGIAKEERELKTQNSKLKTQNSELMHKIGIIDLGSNTTRLIVMAYEPGRWFKLIDEVSEVARLAEGVTEQHMLQPRPIQRAVEALRMFYTFCQNSGVEQIIAVGTSAIREARNSDAFFDALRAATDLKLRIITAEQEAYYGYLGAVNGLLLHNGLVFDTGGGSTQVMEVRNRRLVSSFSRQAGVVRLTERYITTDPISKRELRNLRNGTRELFATAPWPRVDPEARLAGMGGTVRTLARMDQKRRMYPLDKVHGYVLSRTAVSELVELLASKSRREREELPGLKSDRADVTLAGAVIIEQVLEQSGFGSLVVSGQGLREGVFFEEFLRDQPDHLLDNPREFSVRSLARVSNYEVTHSEKVRELSLALFDQLVPLHGYGAWERELLDYAAILHDIGVVVGYYDHHKHSAYLVLNSTLLGFSHREVAIISYLVRNHRKGLADTTELAATLALDDPSRIARLSALLRIAEYLERSKSQVVRSLRVTINANEVVIAVEADGDAAVEIWEAERRSGLFEKAYGVKVRIVAG